MYRVLVFPAQKHWNMFFNTSKYSLRLESVNTLGGSCLFLERWKFWNHLHRFIPNPVGDFVNRIVIHIEGKGFHATASPFITIVISHVHNKVWKQGTPLFSGCSLIFYSFVSDSSPNGLSITAWSTPRLTWLTTISIQIWAENTITNQVCNDKFCLFSFLSLFVASNCSCSMVINHFCSTGMWLERI